MQKLAFSLVPAACAALSALVPTNAVAQEAPAPAAAPESTNCVELVDSALRELIPVLGSPDLDAATAVAAFEKASQQLDGAIMLAKLDLKQARADLDAYNKAGKADSMDALMDNTANSGLERLLRQDEAVQKAFVKFITSLGTFDRILNSAH